MKINAILNTKCDHLLSERLIFTEKPKCEVTFDIGGQNYFRKYLECKYCGHWFSSHDIDLTNLYSEDYVTSTYGDLNGMKKRFEKIMSLDPNKSDNYQRVKRISNFINEFININFKGDLLDIGCGLGVFPSAMMKKGWNVNGTEQDQRTIQHLRENVGIYNIGIDLEEIKNFKINKFDLITLNKVLEHVVDPIDLIKQSKIFLKKTGILYIEVPDTEAASKSHNPYDREEFCIEHHHGFTFNSLIQAVEKSGLFIIAIQRLVDPSGKFTFYCFCKIP